MSVPAWLLDTFAGVMLLVAAVSAARLATIWRAGSRRPDPDADIEVSHLLMGIAMAGTLTASLSTLPSRAWEIIFAALTVWFAYRVTREYRTGRGVRALVSEHHAPHLLHSAAMLYMFLALAPASSHAGSAMAGMIGMTAAGGQTLRLPTLALLFAFLLCAYVVADLDRLPAPRWLHSTTPPALAFAGPAALATTTAPAPAATCVPASAADPVTAGVPASAAATAPASAGVPASAAATAPASAGVGPPAPRALGLPASPATSPTPETSPAPAAPSAPVATSAPVAPEAPGLGRLLSPGVARGCRIAMGVTMAFMLIIMI
jgi:hypothetical protein